MKSALSLTLTVCLVGWTLPVSAQEAFRETTQGPMTRATVSEAVRTFLVSEFQAREVRVTKIAALPGSEAGWEAEAEILVPDLAIMTLGLTLTQEVLELRTYAVQLDQSLTIRSYEPLDHGG